MYKIYFNRLVSETKTTEGRYSVSKIQADIEWFSGKEDHVLDFVAMYLTRAPEYNEAFVKDDETKKTVFSLGIREGKVYWAKGKVSFLSSVGGTEYNM